MNTIDQRIVEMQFDNAQFEKGIQKSIKSLSDLDKSLDFKNSAKSLQDLDRAGKNFSLFGVIGAAEAVSKKFSAMEIVAITALQRIANQAITTGKNLIKSLTLDQPIAGWGKYEQKTASVQTLINSTGKSIDEVNGYLNKLMWFSDETSYSFTDMTASLAQLTTSGGDINKLIPMIMGIANATAFAGKGANEFQRTIYNLNQSYSAGHLQFMDWRSLELAGVASKELKQQFIDTAIAMGKLSKEGKTAKGQLVTIANFGETLKDGWADTEVMEATFGNFAEMTEKAYQMVQSGEVETASEAYAILAEQYDNVALKAAKSAQEAKTFTEAIDATKDAVSSGWMRTFELIIGNYEEAKELWTDVANSLWDVFASGAEDRNELLESWHDMGGRANLLKGLTNIFQSLYGIILAVGEAFRDIFPPMTAQRLLDMTLKFDGFTTKLKSFLTYFEATEVVGKEVTHISKAIEGLDGNLQRGAKGQGVKLLQSALKKLGFEVGEIDGIFGPKTEKALKEFQESIGITADGILDISNLDVLDKLGLTEQTEQTQEATETYMVFGQALQIVKNVFTALFAAVKIVLNVFGFLFRVGAKVLSILSPITNAVLNIVDAFTSCFASFSTWLSESDFLNQALEKIGNFLAPIGEKAKQAGAWLMKFFGFTDEAGKATTKVKSFSEWWDRIKNSIKNTKVWEKLAGAWDSVKKSYARLKPVFKKLYTQAKTFLVDKFGKIWDSIKTAFPSVVGWFGNTFSSILETITPFIEKVPEYLGKVGSFFSGIFNSIGQSELFKKAKLTVTTFFGGIGEKISGFVKNIPTYYENIKKFFEDTWNKLMSNEKFASAYEAISNWISQEWEKIKAFFVNLFDSIITFFSGESGNTSEDEIADSIANAVISDEAVDKVEEKVSLLDKIVNIIKNAWNNIKTVFSAIFNWTWEFFTGKSAGDNVADATEQQVEELEGTAEKTNGFIETVKYIFDKILSITKAIGPYGLLGILGAIFIGSRIKKSANNAKKTVESIRDISSNFKAIQNGKEGKKYESIATSILKICAGIALIVGSIYLIGTMDVNAFTRGVVTLTMIISLILVLSIVTGKMKPQSAKNFQKIGIFMLGIAAIALSIAAAMFILGNMDAGKIVKSMITLSLVLGLLVGFTATMNKISKSGKVKLSGFMQMAAAIGILAGVMWLVGQMRWGTIAKGLIGLTGIMLTMRIFVTSLSKVGGSEIKLSGLIQLSIAIGILTTVMWALGHMKPTTIIKGLLGMIGVMGVLVLFVYAINKIPNASQTKYAGLLALAVTVSILAATLLVVGMMPVSSIAKGLLGLIPIMLALALVVKAATKVQGARQSFSILAMLVGIVMVIGTVAAAIMLLKDVNPNLIASFAFGIAGMIAAFALLMAVIGKFPALVGAKALVGAALVGAAFAIIVAIVTATVAILGVIDDLLDGALVKKLQNGGKVLKAVGEALGSIIRGVKDAVGKSTGLTDIGDNVFALVVTLLGPIIISMGEIVLAVAAPLSELYEKTQGGVLDDMDRASKVLGSVGNVLGSVIGGVRDAVKSADGETTIGDNVFALFVGLLGGPIVDMAKLVTETVTPLGLLNLATAGGIVTLLEEGAKVLRKAGEAIGSVIAGVKDALGMANPDDENALKENTLATIITLLGDRIVEIADKVITLVQPLGALNEATGGGLVEDLISAGEVLKATGEAIAQTINGIKLGLAATNGKEESINNSDNKFALLIALIGDWLTDTGVECAKMLMQLSLFSILTGGDAAGRIQNAGEMLFETGKAITRLISGVKFALKVGEGESEDSLGENALATFVSVFAEKIVSIGTNATALLAALGDSDLSNEENIAKLENGGKTLRKLGNAIGEFILGVKEIIEPKPGQDMTEMGESLNSFQESIAGMGAEGSTISADTQKALEVMTSVSTFLEELSGMNIEENKSALEKFFTGDGKVESVFNDMKTLGSQVKDFGLAIENLGENKVIVKDTSKALTVMRKITSFLSELGDEETTKIPDILKFGDFTSEVYDLGAQIANFAKNTEDVDTSRLTSIVTSIKDMSTALNTLSLTNVDDIDVSAVGSKMNELNAAMSEGITGEADTSGMQGIVDANLAVVKGSESKFADAGFYLSMGLARGISSGGGIVKFAITQVVKSAIAAARSAGEIASPSKATARLGEFMSLGLAKGIDDCANVVANASENLSKEAIDGIAETIDTLSTLNLDDIDSDPVIRPVLDMSSVSAGAKTIDNMLSSSKTISMNTKTTADMAKQASYDNAKNQNGTKSQTISNAYTTDNSVNINGNFSIRDEMDITLLANEIASLLRTQQASVGIKTIE